MPVNEIRPFDRSLLEISISLRQLEEISHKISSRGQVTGQNEITWALKALTLIDLTTLSGDDTAANVRRLCHRAKYPLPLHLLNEIVDADLLPTIRTAAVCVYPARVAEAKETLSYLEDKEDLCPINIAAVATGYPSGQFGLESRLMEIKYAISHGANEIDIVINRQLALNEDWEALYEEVCQMRKACGHEAHMKTILAIGELGTMENVYKAAMCCMLAGADFIKTSTGKEAINATLPVGLAMIYAIKKFHRVTMVKIGLKPAGGVRTVRETIAWMTLVKESLGIEWLNPLLFRFGASGLLDDIEKVLRKAISN